MNVGTDIVSVARVAALMDRSGAAFLQRWFTPGEVAYCVGKAVPSRHVAARLAAKEAVLKALPFAWSGPVPWRMVEVVNGGHGAPGIQLSGAVLAEAEQAGVVEIRISMSHCDEYATAVAMVTSSARRPTPQPAARAEASQSGAQVRPLEATGGAVVDRGQVEQVLAEWSGMGEADADPELAALRLTILFEDVFDVTLTDDDIDLAVLSDPDAMVRVLGRARSGA
ncbi:holo-ACP synthase [Catellatospora sichuanensis]|uniref:holo-ACP synthase n=1 Tax=Catellatospora sichuanensis TaxID=1969805 RepID=UPI001642C73F|nr:holo-ACP synthase [Catellatospora sichuanensis]